MIMMMNRILIRRNRMIRMNMILILLMILIIQICMNVEDRQRRKILKKNRVVVLIVNYILKL